jgi:hypothetical protein
MTGFPEHPASARLALFALCADLVIAIDAMSIVQLRRTAETVSHATAHGRSALEIDDQLVPGWDLGELLGLGPCTAAWVVVELNRPARRVAFRIGRCFMVDPLPVCRAIPPGIFSGPGTPAEGGASAGRAAAITAAFSVAAIPELAGYVSGVVVDLARILPERDLASLASLAKEGPLATLDA